MYYLDVSMANAQFVHPVQSVEHLEGEPLLLQRGQERPCGHAIVHAAFAVFTHEQPCFVCKLEFILT